MDKRATPDAQIRKQPHLNREIWHWGLLHKWKQQKHDMEVPSNMSSEESTDLALVYNNVKTVEKGGLSDTKKEQQQLVNSFPFQKTERRSPLMQNYM